MSDVLDVFADIDACAASDALDSLGLSGAALGLQRLTPGGTVRGRAVTIRMTAAPTRGESAAALGGGTRRHLGTAAVEAARPGDVIVIENQGRVDAACWGGNLARAAVAAGVAALIADGAVRDRDECEELGLQVFARTSVPVTARGRIVEDDWNLPIQLAGVTVHPGDIVIADGSGVVVVPYARATEVARAAQHIVEMERLMASDIDRGVPVSEVMGASYEDLLKGAR